MHLANARQIPNRELVRAGEGFAVDSQHRHRVCRIILSSPSMRRDAQIAHEFGPSGTLKASGESAGARQVARRGLFSLGPGLEVQLLKLDLESCKADETSNNPRPACRFSALSDWCPNLWIRPDLISGRPRIQAACPRLLQPYGGSVASWQPSIPVRGYPAVQGCLGFLGNSLVTTSGPPITTSLILAGNQD